MPNVVINEIDTCKIDSDEMCAFRNIAELYVDNSDFFLGVIGDNLKNNCIE